jgi:hypothetical protein
VLRSIEADVPFDELNTPESQVIITARQRYLLEDDGIVRRDKLIDLIWDEDTFTPRVKMVMYFLFLFRDQRYRDFICTRVADSSGVWNGAVFQSQSTAFFKKAGGRKAFTNLRRMLVHLDLLTDEPKYAVRAFPPLEDWLPDAVEIAAQYVTDTNERQQFLANPTAFLVQHKIHGLLNAQAKAIAQIKVNVVYEDAPDLLPIYQIADQGSGTLASTALKKWDKKAPLKSKDFTPIEVFKNPALMEKANWQHFLLEKLMAADCEASGYEAQFSVHIDLLAQSPDQTILFEMKSCTAGNVRSQIRRAVSQVLEYSYLYRDEIPADTLLCVVVERKPRGRDAWLIGYLESLEICLVWKRDKDARFGCTAATKARMAPVFSAAAGWAIQKSKG